ncbi:hypothetical protein L6164_034315 [Bauhinia variegata]|uniref:Uncharacterized protein n=1 Tax=Bauhinia variegata TaxID=167791 RepID=A0ACB9KUJ3_BAUVA|nr:hypothetical protein L6164_034315 [Bauhinia variegata]
MKFLTMEKKPPWEEVIADADLLGEILLRLPAKSLLKSKCVCKQWLSIISNPVFRRNHVLRHHSPHSVPSALLFSADYAPSPYLIAPLWNAGDDNDKVPSFDYLGVSAITILRSCNGLLLCSAKSRPFLDDLRRRTRTIFQRNFSIPRSRRSTDVDVFRYFVCNPTIKQFVRIPIPNWEIPQDRNGFVFSLFLAYEPLKSPSYKVISLRRSIDNPDKLRIDIYSSVTGIWSDPQVSFTPPLGMAIYRGVFCKGAIHWYSDDHYSLCFDVDSQCLKTMPMPPKKDDQLGARYFGESSSHLYIILLDMVGLNFDVLEMEDNYSGWSVKYHASYENKFSILSLIRGEKENDLTMVILSDGMVLSYNLKHQTLKEVKDLRPSPVMAIARFIKEYSSSEYSQGEVFQYFESLSSV